MRRKCVLLFRAEHVETTTVDTKLNSAHVSYVSGTDKERGENGLRRYNKCTGSCAECASSFIAPNMSKPPRLTPNLSLRRYRMYWPPLKCGTKTCSVRALNALVGASKVCLAFSRRTCSNNHSGNQIQFCTCILCFWHRQRTGRKRAPKVQ